MAMGSGPHEELSNSEPDAVIQSTVSVGDIAPEFELIGHDGKTHKLSDYTKNITVIEWTNHECPFVKKFYDQGHMQAMQQEFTSQGVNWLSIVSSAPGKQGYITVEQAAKVNAAQNAHRTVMLLDPMGEVGRAYRATNTPQILVLKDGKVAYAGSVDDKRSPYTEDIAGANNLLERALNSLIAGQPVETPFHKPYGCTIKY